MYILGNQVADIIQITIRINAYMYIPHNTRTHIAYACMISYTSLINTWECLHPNMWRHSNPKKIAVNRMAVVWAKKIRSLSSSIETVRVVLTCAHVIHLNGVISTEYVIDAAPGSKLHLLRCAWESPDDCKQAFLGGRSTDASFSHKTKYYILAYTRKPSKRSACSSNMHKTISMHVHSPSTNTCFTCRTMYTWYVCV